MSPVPEDTTEPLLTSGNGPVAEAGEDGDAAGKQRPGVWATEFRHILVLSAPAIVQLSTQQALVITNQACCRQDLTLRRPWEHLCFGLQIHVATHFVGDQILRDQTAPSGRMLEVQALTKSLAQAMLVLHPGRRFWWGAWARMRSAARPSASRTSTSCSTSCWACRRRWTPSVRRRTAPTTWTASSPGQHPASCLARRESNMIIGAQQSSIQ